MHRVITIYGVMTPWTKLNIVISTQFHNIIMIIMLYTITSSLHTGDALGDELYDNNGI